MTTGLRTFHAAPSTAAATLGVSSAARPEHAPLPTPDAPISPDVHIAIYSLSDVVTARQHARVMAAAAGFSDSDLTLIATALSEIVRNMVEYAGGGEVSISIVHVGGRAGVEMVARDDGPGIPDVGLVMRDGYSTGGHLGIGLPGARRLVDDFNIQSAPGRGTVVTMKKWLA